jgi:septal ring factor EnvC (AmiA/AmiB activator)
MTLYLSFHGTDNSRFDGIKRLGTGVLLCALTLIICGCASSTDPREGGFFGGVHGLQSGAYEERVQSREDSLNRLRALQAELDAEQTALAAQKGSLEQEIALERQCLAALEQEVSGLEQSLNSYQADDARKKKQINDLQSRLAELKTTMQEQTSALDALEGSGTGNPNQDLRRKQLEEQRRALQEEFDLLMELSLELSK